MNSLSCISQRKVLLLQNQKENAHEYEQQPFLPSRRLSDRGDMGNHLCSYQGAHAQWTITSPNLHLAFLHCLRFDGHLPTQAIIFQLMERRSQDDAIRCDRRFALLLERERSDELHHDHQHLAHRLFLPTLRHHPCKTGLSLLPHQ